MADIEINKRQQPELEDKKLLALRSAPSQVIKAISGNHVVVGPARLQKSVDESARNVRRELVLFKPLSGSRGARPELAPAAEQAKHVARLISQLGTSEGINDQALLLGRFRALLEKHFNVLPNPAKREALREAYIGAVKHELERAAPQSRMEIEGVLGQPREQRGQKLCWEGDCLDELGKALEAKTPAAQLQYELTRAAKAGSVYIRPDWPHSLQMLEKKEREASINRGPISCISGRPPEREPLRLSHSLRLPDKAEIERRTSLITDRGEALTLLAQVTPKHNLSSIYAAFLPFEGVFVPLPGLKEPALSAGAHGNDPLLSFSFKQLGDILGDTQAKDPARRTAEAEYFQFHAKRLEELFYDQHGRLMAKDISELARTLDGKWSSYFSTILNPYSYFAGRECYSDKELLNPSWVKKNDAFNLYAQREVAKQLKDMNPELYTALAVRRPEICFPQLSDPNSMRWTQAAEYYSQLGTFAAAAKESRTGEKKSNAETFREAMLLVRSPYAGFAAAAQIDTDTMDSRLTRIAQLKFLSQKQLESSSPTTLSFSPRVLEQLAALRDAEQATKFFRNLPHRVLAAMEASAETDLQQVKQQVWSAVVDDMIRVTEHEKKLRTLQAERELARLEAAERKKPGEQDVQSALRGAGECERVLAILRKPGVKNGEHGRTFAELCVRHLRTDYLLTKRLQSCFGSAAVEFPEQRAASLEQEVELTRRKDAGIDSASPGLGPAAPGVDKWLAKAKLGFLADFPQESHAYRLVLLLQLKGLLQEEHVHTTADAKRLEALVADPRAKDARDGLTFEYQKKIQRLQDELPFDLDRIEKDIAAVVPLLEKEIAAAKTQLSQSGYTDEATRERLAASIVLDSRVLAFVKGEDQQSLEVARSPIDRSFDKATEELALQDPLTRYSFTELSDPIESGFCNGYITTAPQEPADSQRNKQAEANFRKYAAEYGPGQTEARKQLEKSLAFPQKTSEFVLLHTANFVRCYEHEVKKTLAALTKQPDWEELSSYEQRRLQFVAKCRTFEEIWNWYAHTAAKNPYREFSEKYAAAEKELMHLPDKEADFGAWLEGAIASTLRHNKEQFPEAFQMANLRRTSAMYGVKELGRAIFRSDNADIENAKLEYIHGITCAALREMQGLPERRWLDAFHFVVFSPGGVLPSFYGQNRYNLDSMFIGLFGVQGLQSSAFSTRERAELLKDWVNEMDDRFGGTRTEYGWMPQQVMAHLVDLAALEQQRSAETGLAANYYTPVLKELTLQHLKHDYANLKEEEEAAAEKVAELKKSRAELREIQETAAKGSTLTKEQEERLVEVVPAPILKLRLETADVKEHGKMKAELLAQAGKWADAELQKATKEWELQKKKLDDFNKRVLPELQQAETELKNLRKVRRTKPKYLADYPLEDLKTWTRAQVEMLSREQVAAMSDEQLKAVEDRAYGNRWIRERFETQAPLSSN